MRHTLIPTINFASDRSIPLPTYINRVSGLQGGGESIASRCHGKTGTICGGGLGGEGEV